MTDCILIQPRNAQEWDAYHNMRRRVLFEAPGRIYDANHLDERCPGNSPRVLLAEGRVVGVARIDLHKDRSLAYLRLVAIESAEQRKGHGREMMPLGEEFIAHEGFQHVRAVAASDAVGFYKRLGYTAEPDAPEAARPILRSASD